MYFTQLYRYGRQLNSHDLVKIVAISLMVVDHIGEYLMGDNIWCRMIGRGAAPLFFFLVGYDNRLHVTPALIIYGLILSFMGVLLWDHFWINILINFILVQALLIYFPIDKLSATVALTAFVLLSVLNGLSMLVIEYGCMGILWAYSGRLCALKSPHAFWGVVATGVVYFLWENVTFSFYKQPEVLGSFTALVIFLIFGMITYQVRPFNIISVFRIPGLFLSRYSLVIYFYHLFFLQCYYLYIHTKH